MSSLGTPTTPQAGLRAHLHRPAADVQPPFSPQPQSMPEIHGRLQAYQQAIERQASALNRAEGRMTALLEENAYLQERLVEAGKLAAQQGMSNDQRCEELQRAFSATTQQLVTLTNDNQKLNELLQAECAQTRHLQADHSNLLREVATERGRVHSATEQLHALTREHEEVKSMAANLHSSLQAERHRCSLLEADVSSCRAGEAEMGKQIGALATAATQAAHRATEAAAALRRCEEQLQACTRNETALRVALEASQGQVSRLQAQLEQAHAQGESTEQRVEVAFARRIQEVESNLAAMRAERDSAVRRLEDATRAGAGGRLEAGAPADAQQRGGGAIEVTQSTAQGEASTASADALLIEQDSMSLAPVPAGQPVPPRVVDTSTASIASMNASAARELSFSDMGPPAPPAGAAAPLDTTLQRIELARTSALAQVSRDNLARAHTELAVERERGRALQRQVEDIQAALSAQRIEATSWREACERAQARVSEVYSSAGQAQREALLTTSERIGQAEEQVSQAQQEVEGMAVQAEEGAQRIAELEGEVQHMRLLLASITSERDSCMRTCDTLRAHAHELEASMQQSAAEVQQAKVALSALRAADAVLAEEKAVAARGEAEGALQAVRSELHSSKEEIARLKAQIQAFNDHVQAPSAPVWFPGLVDAMNGKAGSLLTSSAVSRGPPPSTGPYALSSLGGGTGWGASSGVFTTALPRATSEAIHASVRGTLEREMLSARQQVSAALSGRAGTTSPAPAPAPALGGGGESALRDSMASLRHALQSPQGGYGSSSRILSASRYRPGLVGQGAGAAGGGGGGSSGGGGTSPTATILANLRQELAVSRAKLTAAASLTF